MGFTFASVIEKVRERKLAQPDSNFYDDPFMLELAIDATSDMAYRLGFPVKRSENIPLPAGGDRVIPPRDMLPNGIKDVLYEDLGLERAISYGDLRMNSAIGPNPEFYYWNPLMAPQLLLAPDSADGGTIVVVYQASLYIAPGGVYRAPTVDSEVWGQTWNPTANRWDNGLYPDMEEVASLATTVAAWRAGVQFEKADYYEARFESRIQQEAVRLGQAKQATGGEE